MSRSSKHLRRQRPTGLTAPQRRPFLEYLEDRQLLANGLTGDYAPPIFQAAALGSGSTVNQQLAGTSAAQASLAGHGSDQSVMQAQANLGSAALLQSAGNRDPHPNGPPPPPKGQHGGSYPPVVHPGPPTGDVHTKPVAKPPTPPTPKHPPVIKVPPVHPPVNPGKPPTGAHGDPDGSTKPKPKPPKPVDSKPVVSKPVAPPSKPPVSHDADLVGLTHSTPGPTLPTVPISYRPPGPVRPADDTPDDVDNTPQPAAAKSTPAVTQGSSSNDANASFLASAAPPGPAGSLVSTGTPNNNADRGNVDQSSQNVSGQPLARGDSSRLVPQLEARATVAVHEQTETIASILSPSARALAALQAGSGGALLGGNFGQVAEPASRREYAVAAGSVLAQDLSATGNSSSAQTLSDRGAEWGFLLGWALAMPPGRMKHQPTIMLVESDETARDAMTIKLVQEGFLVLPAATGRDAMNVLRAPLSPIDVMLLDTHLPDVSGVHLFERLRQLYPTLPVAVWMGDPQVREAAQLRNLGMHHYLPKPVEMEKLVTTIRGLLG